MAQLGFRKVDEMVGQVQKLNRKAAIDHFKASGIDLTPILHTIDVPKGTKFYNTKKQQHDVNKSIEFEIIQHAHPALFRKEKTVLDFPIHNTDRAVGAIVSNEISKIYGSDGLPENTL